MDSKLFAILVLLSVFRWVDGWCDLKSKNNCDIHVICKNNFDRHFGSFENACTRARNTCGPSDEDTDYYKNEEDKTNNWLRNNLHSVFLETENIDMDTDWYNHKLDSIMDTKIVGIKFSNISQIPVKITRFHNLREVAIENFNDRELQWISFVGLKELNKLNVSNNNIQFLQPAPMFEKLHKVEEININYNSIEILPNFCFTSFSQLRNLNLSHNMIKTIETFAFGSISESMSTLETLDLSYNRLLTIEHNFLYATNLKNVYLTNNQISIIGSNFEQLINLERLNISSNKLTLIEDYAFRVLHRLQELDLSNNRITKINKLLLWSNTKIRTLLLTNNTIKNIESEAFKGKNITSFDFYGNNLQGTIQKRSFDGITTDTLNLSNEKIISLDLEAFAGLQTRVLNLSSNILSTISATSFRSIQVADLDLSNNTLNSIDFETVDLQTLLTLNLRMNNISKISKLTLENLISLTKLDFSQNKISDLDEDIFSELASLKFLDLSHNLLSRLTTYIFYGLFDVVIIQLTHNQLTAIENEAFAGLKSLKILNCSCGELTDLDYNAFIMTGSLEVLDLSDNMLNDFTVNITGIYTLKELYLNRNYIQNISESVFDSMNNLEKLHLAKNNILKLELISLPNLRSLDLSSNPAVDIENILIHLSFLSELKLANVNFTFSFEHTVNKSISSFDLSRNDIENINEVFIFKINDIAYLDLHANQLTFVDKYSFQNLPSLIWLDLSCNLIAFIQPGTFLLTNRLKSLNLHGNFLPAVQFGVLDGLHDLETLNLSKNALHEFSRNLLHKTPNLSTIALDNNVIENINFKEFVPSSLKLITIGGNPMSCHSIIDYNSIHSYTYMRITAVTLDFHSENVNGISCISNLSLHENVTVTMVNKNDNVNFWMMNKAIENFRTAMENLRFAIEKTSIKSLLTDEIKNTNLELIQINNEMNSRLSSIEHYITTFEKIQTDSNSVNTTESDVVDSNVKEKIKLLNDEKDIIVKEIQDIIQNLRTEFHTNKSDNYSELKGGIYFVAICLTILIVLFISIILYKFINSIARRNSNSSHRMTDAIELQD